VRERESEGIVDGAEEDLNIERYGVATIVGSLKS